MTEKETFKKPPEKLIFRTLPVMDQKRKNEQEKRENWIEISITYGLKRLF